MNHKLLQENFDFKNFEMKKVVYKRTLMIKNDKNLKEK